MKIERVTVFPLRLPIRDAFYIAGKVAADPSQGAPHIYVRLIADDGSEGWGEARPSPRWSYETPESVVTTIRRYFAPLLEGWAVGSIDELHRRMDGEIAAGPFPGQPIARSAIDTAVHDLLARSAGLSLCRYLGGADPVPQPLACLVTARTAEEYVEKVSEARSRNYRGYKVKIGKGVGLDVEILQAIRKVVGDAYVWADANAAYTFAEARDLSRRVHGLVEVLEQPLPAEDWEGAARLSAISDVPIALDESLYTPRSILQYLNRGPLHALVVKVNRCGGVRPCFVSGLIAREAGAFLLGSGLTDSRLALATACHVFQALGIESPPDLNGPQFIGGGPVEEAVPFVDGVAMLPPGPGIGFQPSEEAVQPFVDADWDRL